jgi:diguanylate cyclase (GGDEF)-like protein
VVFFIHGARRRLLGLLRPRRGLLERELLAQRHVLGVSEAMLAVVDESVVFERIADALGHLVAYDTLAISKVEREAGLIRTVFARGEHAEELIAGPLRSDEGLTGWVVAHDKPVLCNDLLTDPRGVLIAGTPDDEPQASIIVPLRVRGAVIGVLSLDRLGGRAFADAGLETVTLFANLAAVAIENASLHERTQVRAVTDSLTGIFDHGHFQETLAREAKRCERYGEGFSLLMMDLDHFKVVNDRYGHLRGDEVLRAVARILQETARESDYAARYGGEEFALILPRTSSTDGCALAERLRERIAAIPVASGDGFHLSASVGVADYPACGLDARTVLSAADTALLWAKRRGRNCILYYRDVREMVVSPLPGDVTEAFWAGGLDALAAAVDAKASFRERHGEAVAGMVRELAAAAGCSAAEVDLYEVAARLHDVGKVGIATEILTKTESLTTSEIDELKRHVDVGVDILRNADAPRELQPPVHQHHERWDGLGYPDGLRGEEISLGARLIAICDSFQAMLCDRPYRAARSLQDARDEIRRGAGVQFDPRLAVLFLDACAASGAGVPPSPPTSA